MCSQSVPFSISSNVPVTTCQGVGKITLPVDATSAPPDGDQQRDHRHGGKRLLDPAHVEPGARRTRQRQPRPRSRGKRLDDDGHLPARVRRAGELIARCERRTAVGSSGRASSGSVRRSAGTSSRFRSTRTSRTPRVRRISSGRISDLVAGHAARPGALRDLEQLRRASPSGPARSAAQAISARARSRPTTAIARAAPSRLEQDLDVVHVVVGRVPVRHQRAQLALRDRSGRCTTSGRTRSSSPAVTPRGGDPVLLAHGGELLGRARCRRRSSGRSSRGTCAAARRRRARGPR